MSVGEIPAAKPSRHHVEPAEEYRPFPTEILPSPLRECVDDNAKSLGCDPAFVALPLLSAIGAAIGNTHWIEMENGKCLPPAIWTLTVGASGTSKSPGFKIAEKIFRRKTAGWLTEYEDAAAEHKTDAMRYKAALSQWEKNGAKGDPPAEIEPLRLRQCLTSNATVESLGPLLKENPRGILLARNELNGFLQGFGQYKGGAGADETHFMEMFDGDSLTVHRRAAGAVPLFVESALLSITGTIQPLTLRRAFTADKRESGLAARFLLAHPPRIQERWSGERVKSEWDGVLAALFDRLFELESPEDEPFHCVRMDSDACRVWEGYFNGHHQVQYGLEDEMAAVWSKLLNYTSRFALIFHIIEQVWNFGSPTEEIPSATLYRAIGLANWFKRESQRIYGTLDEDQVTDVLRQAADWIKRQDGSEASPREIVRGIKAVKNNAEAEDLMHQLVKSGLAKLDVVKTGGREKWVCRIL